MSAPENHSIMLEVQDMPYLHQVDLIAITNVPLPISLHPNILPLPRVFTLTVHQISWMPLSISVYLSIHQTAT